MVKSLSIAVTGLIICLSLHAACFCDEDGDDKEIGRYQIYSSCGAQSFTVLLDTKTGKVWQLSSEMTGKLKAEGVTVEGLAFASKEADAMKRKIGEINIDDVSEKNQKECKNKLISAFSYDLDSEKIDNVIQEYLRSGK